MPLYQWIPWPGEDPLPGIFWAQQINEIGDLDTFIAGVLPSDLTDENVTISNLVNAGESDGKWTLTFDLLLADMEEVFPTAITESFEAYVYVSRENFPKTISAEAECYFESRFEPVEA